MRRRTVALTAVVVLSPLMALAPRLAHATAARTDGSALVYAPTGTNSAQNPCYSPNGATLAFTQFHNRYNGGDAGVWKVPSAGGTAAKVFDHIGTDSVNLPGACWNRDTGRVGFATDFNAAGGDEIWTANADGTGATQITHHPTGDSYIEPAFSPNGQWIVFEHDLNVANDASQRASIEIVSSDGKVRRVVVNGPGTGTDNREPNWSPDGTRIVFQRHAPAGQWDVYTVAPDGTQLTPVTSQASDDTDASWAPNGRSIVYSSDYNPQSPTTPLAQANLLAVVPGTAPVRVTNQPYYDGAPSWSPDGGSIAFESGPSGDDGGPGTSLFKIKAPALAPGGPSVAAGYLVADRPTAPSYTPALAHQYNSTRASNTVTRSSTGIYQAHLPGLGAAAGGTVDVTPYGATPAGLHCVAPSWTVSSGAVVANVRCYKPGSVPADGPFTLAYARAAGTASTPFAYVWGNSPTTPSYTPPAAYRYNSSGGTNTIARTSTGRYVASLPGLGGSGGAAMVTATAGSNLCKVVSWSAATSVEKVSVACNSSSGAAADTSFALSFARGQNLLGDGWRSSASAFADQPTAASYTPATQSTVGTPATVSRLATGRYRMVLGAPYVGTGGDVQVAGVGTGGGPCAVLGWQAGGFAQQVDVQCTSSTGAPADERFVASYRG